jgi:hypothetical protein
VRFDSLSEDLISDSPWTSQEALLREHKATELGCGLRVTIVGLGLYSYYVRELLASLVLFAAAFFILGLAALGVFLIWCASVQVAIWTPPASRNMIAYFRRLITATVKF